ncbi:tonB-dependent Receptor Plug domain protein, partial [Vibrio parahaemolyticus VPTS-2010]
TW